MGRGKKQAKPETKNIVDILNNSDSRAKLQNYIDEAVACKMRIADEQENIKALRELSLDKLGAAPKDFNAILKLVWKNDFEETQERIQTLDAVIELLSPKA